MALNINNIQAKEIRAIGNRVLVTNMHFGEQKTASGLIIGNDDGKTRGIYPRWAKVYSKGPDNKDEYDVGQWILIEHGRWTRSIKLDVKGEEIEIRMVESESVLAYSDEKPNSISIGAEYADGEHATIDPSSFVTPNR
jgi:co-chaperonin GroES (HSP10)